MTSKALIEELHPGRTILEDVVKPLGLSVNSLAQRLHVPASRMNDIVRGKRGVTGRYGPAIGPLSRDFFAVLAQLVRL